MPHRSAALCRLALPIALFVILLVAMPARAAETILLYRSHVDVETNGDLIVTETIRVRAEDRRIRHGIYRDFPTTFEDANGHVGHSGFTLLSASRDGQPENTRVRKNGSMVRIYLGSSDTVLQPGVYTYQLKYRTDRQIRFFEDHDEVDWNATGTEWLFPIEKAEATVKLPDGAKIDKTAAFTGSYGSRQANATSSVSSNGNVAMFQTTAPLGPREGLSVVVGFQKGIVRPPSRAQQLTWYLRDHLAALLAAGGLALVFAYYLYAWLRVGRDPPDGVVVPRWHPPRGVSPALTHYIWNRGLRRQGFPALSAAAINLAVKGYIDLDIGDATTLRSTDKPASGARLPAGEAALMNKLAREGGALTISAANGRKVAALGTSFRRAIESENRNVFYRHNYGWIVPGVVLSVLTVLAALVFANPGSEALATIIPLLFVGVILVIFGIKLAKGLRSGLGGKIRFAFTAFFMVVVLVNSGIFAANNLLDKIGNPVLAGALVTLVLVNLLFFFLIGAPTSLGRKRMDEIEGLKRYLAVAEKDRMNMAGAPEMSPEHYETLLPYAVALNVEKPWSRAFQSWLAAATAAGVATAAAYYGPHWYHGAPFSSGSIGDRLGSLAGSMSNSFTAALPAPKSSSSGFSSGGGFSGGGGGGGGGGGW